MSAFSFKTSQDVSTFWVGVLTGAVIVSLVFLYRIYGHAGTASLLNSSPSYSIQKAKNSSVKKFGADVTDPGFNKPVNPVSDPGFNRPRNSVTDPGFN